MSIKTFRYEKQHNYADKNIRARLLEEIKEHPGRFASEHEYGCLNIIGKAKERKDLHCRASALGEAYRERLFAKAAQWKPEPRTRRSTHTSTKKGGIEKSLPRGDR